MILRKNQEHDLAGGGGGGGSLLRLTLMAA